MERSAPVDGFRLAYERSGTPGAPGAVLIHGWPGDHGDWRTVADRLAADHDVVVPDLRGFGESDALDVEPADGYDASAQARSVAALADELGLAAPVLCGYDVGSRVAQRIAAERPDRVGGLVLAPPLPGVGERVHGPDQLREFWYQTFHRSELPETLLDGREDAVRAYLAHIWDHWSGPDFDQDPAELARLAAAYARPGRLLASIAWYRAGAGTVATALAEHAPAHADRLAVPTRVLWPEHDPLFPREWADRLEEWFADVTLTDLPGAGHFSPLEAPEAWATAIRAASLR